MTKYGFLVKLFGPTLPTNFILSGCCLWWLHWRQTPSKQHAQHFTRDSIALHLASCQWRFASCHSGPSPNKQLNEACSWNAFDRSRHKPVSFSASWGPGSFGFGLSFLSCGLVPVSGTYQGMDGTLEKIYMDLNFKVHWCLIISFFFHWYFVLYFQTPVHISLEGHLRHQTRSMVTTLINTPWFPWQHRALLASVRWRHQCRRPQAPCQLRPHPTRDTLQTYQTTDQITHI